MLSKALASICLVYLTTVTRQIYIYLYGLSTCDSRPCLKTALEDETVSVLSAIGASLLWFFLYGYFGSSFTFKDIGTTFMPFFKAAKLALNPTIVFSLLTL